MKLSLLLIIAVITQFGDISVSYAQELPQWVLEMRKSKIDFPKLQKSFNEFWSDKMDDEMKIGEESKMEEREYDFPIKKEYSWLNIYLRQYFEVVKLGRTLNVAAVPEKDRTRSGVSLGNWIPEGPFNKPENIYNASSYLTGVGRVNQLAFSSVNANMVYAVSPSGLYISYDTAGTWNATNTDFN
jgi:hypothetical protein